MKTTWVDIVAVVVVAVVVFGGIGVLGYTVHSVGYEIGQRDALNGKWKYTKLKDAAGNEYVVEIAAPAGGGEGAKP